MLPLVVSGNFARRRVQPFPTGGGGGGGGPIPAWASSLALNTWVQIANTRLDSHGGDFGVTAYCGAAVGPKGPILGPGGGHGDSDNNIVQELDLTLDAPILRTLCTESSSGAKVPGAAFNSDGKAAGRHNYGNPVFVPSSNRLMMLGTSIPANYSSGGEYLKAVCGMDYATGVWDSAATFSNTAYADHVANTNDSFVLGTDGICYGITEAFGNLVKFDPATKILSNAGVSSAGGLKSYIACDTLRNRLVVFGATPARYDLPSLTRTTFSFSGAQSGHATGNDSSWVYCPDLDVFLGVEYYSAPTVYQCHPTTFAVTSYSVAGSVPPHASDGHSEVYGRWGYFASGALRVMFFIPQASVNAYAFRVA